MARGRRTIAGQAPLPAAFAPALSAAERGDGWERLASSALLSLVHAGRVEEAYAGAFALAEQLPPKRILGRHEFVPDCARWPGEAQALCTLAEISDELVRLRLIPDLFWNIATSGAATWLVRVLATDGATGTAFERRFAPATPARCDMRALNRQAPFACFGIREHTQLAAVMRFVGRCSPDPVPGHVLRATVAIEDAETFRAFAASSREGAPVAIGVELDSAGTPFARAMQRRVMGGLPLELECLFISDATRQDAEDASEWAEWLDLDPDAQRLADEPDPRPAWQRLGLRLLEESHAAAPGADGIEWRRPAEYCTHQRLEWMLNTTGTAAIARCPTCRRDRLDLIWRDALPEDARHAVRGAEAERIVAARELLARFGPVEPRRDVLAEDWRAGHHYTIDTRRTPRPSPRHPESVLGRRRAERMRTTPDR